VATPAKEPRAQASARLRSARLRAGLTQERAADLVGVDARQLRRWENGEVPLGPLELLLALEEKIQVGGEKNENSLEQLRHGVADLNVIRRAA